MRLRPGIDLPHFYNGWQRRSRTATVRWWPSFNHPTPDQYNNWAHRDAKVTDIITMLEVINQQ